MTDRWRASVCTIGGKPVAVVDVEIRRTLFINPALFDLLRGLGNENGLPAAGLSAATEFIREIQTVPADARRFYVEPWQPVDNERINMKPFSEIMRLLDEDLVWRVVGDAAHGFTGLLYVGGVERSFDMSESALSAFNARVALERQNVEEAYARGDVTKEVKEAIVFVCNKMGWDSEVCRLATIDLHNAQKKAEQNEREMAAKNLADRERELNDTANSRGPRMSDSYSGLK